MAAADTEELGALVEADITPHNTPHNQHKRMVLDLVHTVHCLILQLLKFPYLPPPHE
ncbi:hypothetical protein AGMMS49593_01480 [Endomicrobiia bacterium]|nr:hypothetical protein AGMMS49593_01480 [Endomicrobiia bacterium]